MTWVQRCAVALVVVVLGCFAATVQPEPAPAFYDAITTVDDWAIVDDWLRAATPPPEVVDAGTRTRWGRIKAASKAVGLGGMGAAAGVNFPTLAIAAGGLAFGWEIGHASGLSDWASGQILGMSTAAYGGTITAANWKAYTCATTGSPIWDPCGTAGLPAGSRMWELDATTGDPCTSTDRVGFPWTSSFGSSLSCNEANNAIKLAWMEEMAETQPGAVVVTGNCGGSYICKGLFMPWSALMGSATYAELRPYNATSDAATKTHTFAAVPRPGVISYGSADADALEDALENDEVLGPRIGTILHPSTDDGDTTEAVALPQPRLNETFAQYRTRLRALGFLGTITLSELALPDPNFGPSVVTGVEVDDGTITTVDLLDPWPDPPPTLTVPGATTVVTVTANPNTAPVPEPGEPGSAADPPPGNAPPPGGGGTINVGDCECPAPDFSPVTENDYGSVFPFGVLLVVDDWLDDLSGTAEAPSWTFDDFEHVGVEEDYTLDLAPFDDYAGMIRTILSWAMWIGALWWFGTRWLGFHGTGDPGEAIDEAWS